MHHLPILARKLGAIPPKQSDLFAKAAARQRMSSERALPLKEALTAFFRVARMTQRSVNLM